MQEPDLISLFVKPLEKAGMRYLVAGSVGAMHYSEPRLTLDVDIPILIMPKEIPTLLNNKNYDFCASILFNHGLQDELGCERTSTDAFAPRMGQVKNKNSASKLDRF